jgi:D-arabinose 5-phosphate isomerase GutQ
MDAETVANDLAKHEAVCAERWKTAFNRFDDLDENVKRIETILISAAGTIIVAGCGLIVTLWMNHM